MPENVGSVISEVSKYWPPEQKAATLRWAESACTRAIVRSKYRNAAELMAAVDPTFVITPAIQLIADSIETTLRYPRRNLLVTMSPQEGKSTLCAVATPLRALQLNPNTKTILATYGDELAESHSMRCRELIESHGSGVTDDLTGTAVEDKLGLSLGTSRKVSKWSIAEGSGGLVAVGLDSSITGRQADLFIIDDPYKNMKEADSKAQRRKVSEWLRSVVLTRLSPSASIILIQTRWHPEDLAGEIIRAEESLPPSERSWRVINVPAISEQGIPDALHRDLGETMVSARGRTSQEFAATRRNVGERVWYALYQGAPAPPSGGMFDRSWFTPIDVVPPGLASIVAIDPADTGEGDETGLIAGTLLDASGNIAFTHDRSGHMTADTWGRAAVRLALEVGAREIALEAYAAATTYTAVLKRAYRDIHTEAMAKHVRGEQLDEIEARALSVQPPFIIHQWRGKGDDVARSSFIRQSYETGKLLHTAALSTYEDQAALWQPGQHQPDRVAAGVIAHDRLSNMAGKTMAVAAPLGQRAAAATNVPAWLRQKIG